MMKPLGDRLVVQRTDPEQKTASGIYIPDSAREKPQEGKVIAAGPGLRDKSGALVPMDVKKGDKILFSKYGGTDITIEGKDYLILKTDDVLGVLG